MAKPSKCLVVLGMHRSGTSMVTRLLNLAGAYFGSSDQHTGYSEENPKGFWERKDVRYLNDMLLFAAQADWFRPHLFDRATLPDAVYQEFLRLANSIHQEFQRHPLVVVKEPRLCLTLDLWPIFARQTALIWVHRHPMEVALSLQRRNHFPIPFGLALWEWYTVNICRQAQNLPVVHVHHSDLLQAPNATLARVLNACHELGFEGLRMPAQAEINAFVTHKLHRSKLSLIPEAEHLSPFQAALWQETSAPEVDLTRLPTSPSRESLAFLAVAQISATGLLARLDQSEIQRSQALNKAVHWQQMAEKALSHNKNLKQELRQQGLHNQRLLHRVKELEQAWTHLRASRLWKMGLFANKLRSLMQRSTKAPPLTAPDPEQSKSIALQRSITVIVPIFNALEQVRVCLQSLVSRTRFPHRLLLINDASTQDGMVEFLEHFAQSHAHVTLETHEKNQGYTVSINHGISWAGQDHVVLLNSDTEVPLDWLERLNEVAHSATNIATVTPLSNAAGAFSIPENHVVNALPEGYTVDVFARLIHRLSPGLRPKVPTGNGFCLFIRREALDAIGVFDQDAFPRGYGEENDFCMRASQAGFIHLIDDRSFVFHHRSASFGEEKATLQERARHILAERWPGYKDAIKRWLETDPLDKFRLKLQTHLQSHPQPEPEPNASNHHAILYILHDGGGGTKLTSMELMTGLPDSYRSWMLLTGIEKWQLVKPGPDGPETISEWRFSDPWRVEEPMSLEKRVLLERICTQLGIQWVHIRHLLGNAPEIVTILKQRALKVIFSFHDFYTVCPNVQLLDRSGHFCGGDCHANSNLADMEEFSAPERPGDCRLAGNWFIDAPLIRHHYVHTWRERVAQALEACDGCITTSQAAKDIIVQHFPIFAKKTFAVIEHGRDLTHQDLGADLPKSGPVRLVSFGALNHTKGLGLLARLAELDRGINQFEIHLLGQIAAHWKAPNDAVVIHGPYQNRDLPSILNKIKPAITLIPTACHETYCHALTETWAAGIPAICSNLGALRERVLAHGGGWLADPQNPEAWYQLLQKIIRNPADFQRKKDQAKAYPLKTTHEMVEAYIALYQQIFQASPT